MDRIGSLWSEWNAGAGRNKKRLKENLIREIWCHYHPRLQVFLSSLPGEEREDRVSEILLKVFESLEKYNPEYAFSTWLYRIARNDQIDRYRRKSPRLVEWQEEIHSPEEERDTPEKIVLHETEKELIREAIETLRADDRELLYLAGYEELPYREISQIIGRPVGTIKYEMHRIRKELKSILKEDFCYEAE